MTAPADRLRAAANLLRAARASETSFKLADLLDAIAHAVDFSGAADHPEALSIADRALTLADHLTERTNP